MSVEVCEHWHLASKCEVCLRDGDIKELRAEIARLRSVCREAARRLTTVSFAMRQDGLAWERMLGVIADLERDGKEPSDGE